MSLFLVTLQSISVRLLLKTPHMWIRTGYNQDGTEMEVLSLLTTFHSIQRCQARYGKSKLVINHKHMWTLWDTIMTGLARHAYWCNNSINIIGVITHFLGDFIPTPQYETQTLHPFQTWNLWLIRNTWAMCGKPITILMLNGYNTILTSNALSLYSHVNAFLNLISDVFISRKW